MKRILTIMVTIIISIGLLGGSVSTAYAGSSASSAVKQYKNALKKEAAAKSAYNTAAKEYNKGSLGFFTWVAANNSGWIKQDAEEAKQLLGQTAFKKYTTIGSERDATSLKNMKKAIKLLPILQAKRAGDPNFPGLPDATVRNIYMARAQVNANASAFTMAHMPEDTGYETNQSCENLAWGYANPFDGWYDEEKRNYDAMRAYFLKKYSVDINDEEAEDALIDRISWDTYEKEYTQFGEIGHYCNVCCGKVSYATAHGTEYGMANRTIFGLAVSQNNEWDSGSYCLNGDAFDTYDASFTISEYTSLFNTYYNKVYPSKELTAYNNATANTKAALKKLKKAAAPKKPTAKRSKKKVTVRWKKVSGVSGYQISVSPSKGKTKIVATVKKKTAKKTVKIKKAKKQYVKVRSFVKVNGKTIYSNWSKVSATK